MYNLLRCRRGTTTLLFAIALVPLMGVVGIGSEAGLLYVTKERAQNTADSAALSGALKIANSNSQSDFGTLNGFSNVTVTQGSYSTGSGFLSGGTPVSAVQATVTQCEPQSLSLVLVSKNCTDANGKSQANSFTIKAQAVAIVQKLAKNPCVLALTGSISFQGSPNINAPDCGMASNDHAKDALNFTGGGMSINLGTLSAAGGCTGTASFCNTALTYMPPVTNPFSALDGALTTLCGANPSLPAKCGRPKCTGSGFVAYSAATPCTNDGFKAKGNTAYPLAAGVYFISGTLTMTGGSSITGTGVTFILLPGATIDTKGGGTITIKGPTTAPSTSSLPAALQPDAGLFQYMAIYDASATAVQFGGNSNINLSGNIYAPTADVTFQGNPTIDLGGANGCGELIAKSVAFNGNATLNSTGCSQAEKPNSQYVRLVQ